MGTCVNDFVSHIDDVGSGKIATHPYYYFEPWDVQKRAQWILDLAINDGIDLNAAWFAKHVGTDPHPFQSGYILSDTFFNAIVAGTQIGKTWAAICKMAMMMTGEIPYAFRFDAGVDTGIKRLITIPNIIRFGRRDSTTGEVIDFNTKAPSPSKWDEWDCGTIVGVGKFPEHLIAPPGEQFWIGTYMKALDKTWWPRFSQKDKLILPPHFIDRHRGNEGYSVEHNTVFLIRNQKLMFVTYESGHERFESESAFAIVDDEEPEGDEGEKIISSCKTHCKYLSLVETPYQGLTFTKSLIFPEAKNPQYKVWHATRYDCPYLNRKLIEAQRVGEKPWLIAARVWGFHAEQTGRPYYDRAKLNIWMQKFKMPYRVVQFHPTGHFLSYGPAPGFDGPMLLDVSVVARDADETTVGTWRMYEDVLRGTSYVITGDPAEGAENPEDAGDNSAALVMRGPIKERNETKPVIVARMTTTLMTTAFARNVASAARYYNNALMAVETRKSASNATFAGEMRTWPYWFKMTVIQEATQRARDVRGFDPTAKTRQSIFKLIEDWISEYDKDTYPGIPDEDLMVELAACVVGKNGRPDHTKNGSLDIAICFGIGLYVFKFGAEQVVYNGDTDKESVRESKIQRLLRERSEPSGNPLALPAWRR